MAKSILSFFLSIVTVFMSFTATLNIKKAPDYETDFVPVLRFEVMSDTHVKAIGDTHSSRLQKAVSFAYDYANKSDSYKNLDAVVIAGDLTNNGTYDQFTGFAATVKSVVKNDTNFLAVVAKNHDGYTHDRQSLEIYSDLTGNDADYHSVINGYHFIGISASKTKGEHYSEYQREWLRNELDKAVADDPTKPVFITHHEHVLNTVYGSSDFDGWGMDYFKDILSDYPQIVDFSGHSHYPLNDPRSIWQGDFTAVGTGAIAYMELTVENDRKVHPKDFTNAAQAWIVEVDAENRVRLVGVDVLRGEYLCEYIINSPAQKDTFEYTPEKMEAASSAPAFAADAKISAKKVFGQYQFTVPAARSTDGKIVFIYKINIYDEDGNNTYSDYIVNNYWNAQPFKTVTFKPGLVKSGSTVEITAMNAYYMASDALTYTVK